MSIYRNTLEQSVSRAVRSQGAKDGLSPAELARIDEHTRKNLLPFLDGFGLDDRQSAELLSLALHNEIEKAAGRMTPEMVKAWDAHVYADLRAQGLNSNNKIGARLKAIEQRLFEEKPDAHAALERAYPLGHHPRVVRWLKDWHDRRTADEGAKTASAKAKMVPRASAMTPPPSGKESAVALGQLGKSSLGAELDV